MSIQMTSDQFQQLIHAMAQGRIVEGSLADCTQKFDGTRDYQTVENFITNVSTYINTKNITETNAILGFGLLLTGEATNWWRGIKGAMRTWKDITTTLRKVYQPPQPNWLLFKQISEDQQSETEPTDAYVTRQMSKLSRLVNFPMQEPQQIDLMYAKLRLKIRQTIPRDKVNTIIELLTQARTVEQHEQEAKVHSQTGTLKKTCSFCKNHGHLESECRKKKQATNKAQFIERTQSKPTNQPMKSDTTGSSKPAFSCYGCGAPNVYRSSCSTCKKVAKPLPQHKEFYSIHQEIGTDLPTVASQIDGYNTMVYLDTCARASVASRELYLHLLDRNHTFEEIMVTITLADGSQTTKLVKRTSTSIIVGGQINPVQFIVIPGARNNKTLLGADFIKERGLVLNLKQDAWCYVDNYSKWFLFDYLQAGPNELTHTNIQELGHRIIQPKIAQLSRSQKRKSRKRNKEYFTTIEPMETSTSKSTSDTDTFVKPIAKTIPSVRPPPEVWENSANDSVDNMLLEIEHLGQILKAQDILNLYTQMPKMLSPITSTPESAKTTDKNQHEIQYCQPDITNLDLNLFDLMLRDNEGTVLLNKQKLEINQFIEQHAEVFNEAGPPTDQTEHRIETLNHLPVATAPYRLPANKREMLHTEIRTMLDQGIIEESESPWATNVVMVAKPNGKWRICIDYRKLNEITVADKYPLPLMDDLLQDARGTMFMTTIDLHSGFWQIKIRSEDREKTAFVTPFGMYQLKRMPFGLKNATATFQRLINKFKNELPGMKLLTYLDDLILISTTFEQHLAELGQIFQKLRKYKLRANREKCRFACSEVKYLGHIINTQGIAANPERIEAIRCRKPPQDLKQLLSFIQTCAWYRRFINDFASIIQPLTNLTKKNVKWEWTQLEQNAFDHLKIKLSTAPVLQQIDPLKPFIIKCDASAYAIGAVLTQGELDQEHPIEYASRLLTVAERNYSTIEREALAVVWSTDKFRGYIDGGVTIISDHQPGKTNVVADCLSRPPCPTNSLGQHDYQECIICSIQIDLPTRGAADIREQQLKDQELSQIITAFEDSNKDEEFIRYTTRGYFMNNGVLYRYNQSAEEETEDALLVIPKHEIQRVLTEYHDAPTAGHYGIQRTTARIASRYSWTGMRKQIADYVSKCKECQKYKTQNLKPAGLIQSTATHQRFETIAIDLFGPLPPSEEGYRHILVIEDIATRWIELFKLIEASAENCADILLNEIFLRYGTPRRIISDNGTQFVSAVMQKLTFCMNIDHHLLPVYHPQANPVERRNRDLKQQLAIQVGTNHTTWPVQLAAIRFAMNTARNDSTGYTPAYLTFGRNLRSAEDTRHDLRAVVTNENFIPEITPKLLQLADTIQRVQENVELMQSKNQRQSDQKRRTDPGYQPGDKVLIKSHPLSKKDQNFAAKLAPKRDGPYTILQKVGAATYEIATMQEQDTSIGIYHTADITPYKEDENEQETAAPTYPIRKTGRPKKQ